MWFGIISLFPEMFQALRVGITGRAIKDCLIKLEYWNPRDFATNKHLTIDDRPYGGGPGMLMMAGPLQAAISAAKSAAPTAPTVIYLSPQGKKLTQDNLAELIAKQSLILLAGRYEGIDERLIEQEIDEEWSVGDYILTGGELPAMIMIDAMARLIPGTVGDKNSVAQDSMTTGLLKYPQYTKPALFNQLPVPEVLLSGNHKEIDKWRLKTSLGKTWLKRPDLLAKKSLNKEEITLLMAFIEEFLQKQRQS